MGLSSRRLKAKNNILFVRTKIIGELQVKKNDTFSNKKNKNMCEP